MTPHPRLSEAGIALVKGFEGLRHRAARLDGGGWTIGYGHTASAREGAEVDADQAEALLIYDLDRVARAIDPLIFAPLNRNQFNALAAFAFNIGVEAFRRSAVLARVNEGALLQAAAALELWRRAAFEGESLVVDGLVRRRAAEKLLFLTPPEGFRATPTPVLRPAHDDEAHLETEGADLEAPLDGERATALRRDGAATVQEPFPESAPAPPPFAEPLAGPALPFDAETGAFPTAADELPPPPPPADFGRRPATQPPPLFPGAASWLAPVAGAVGALLFAASLLAMIYAQATPLNLGAGLAGVVLMTPWALGLMRRVFGERG